MKKHIVVMKFGGASVATGERILAVADIVKNAQKKDRVIVVVSALHGVTDALVTAWNLYKHNQLAEAFDAVSLLYERHMHILNELHLSHEVYNTVERQIKLLIGQLTMFLTLDKDDSASDYDYVVSFGERLSTCLLAASINNALTKAQAVDSSQCIITSNEFGNAKVYIEQTYAAAQKILLPLLIHDCVPVVTGFFGGTQQKEVAILGRGGSDYSATILAYVLHAERVILWKEVDGVFCSDPKINPNAQLFTELSYDKALSLAENGAKVLHRDAMKPVREKDIPVWVKNVFKPAFSGTKIWRGVL